MHTKVQHTVDTNEDQFLLLFGFQVSTHVHHVTSVVKDGHLAVVLNLWRTMLMGPQMQFEAQTCQKLKANCCKMSNKLISWGEFSFANKQCADDKNSINASHANGDDEDAPPETLGCCRWQRRGWWGQCRGNRRKSVVGIWEGKSSEQFQNLYQWFRQD